MFFSFFILEQLLISFMLNFQMRSCSSGKQRRSRLPSKFTDKDVVAKGPLLAEERLVGSMKPRSPSPPIRRSISTDRAAVIRPRIKSDALDNPPVIKVPFPASLSVNKSVANVPLIIPSVMNTRLMGGSQEPSLPNALNSLHRVTLRRVQPENEEEQFKQALNVRQGGIRKTKPESKVKIKQQASAKAHKSVAAEALLSDVGAGKRQDETEKADFSDPENEPFGLAAGGNTRMKKLQRNFSKNSQNVEPRYIIKLA